MNLYRRSTLEASLLVLLAGLMGFSAMQAQRRKPHKLRATALVELTTDSHGVVAARLVPITILDDGSFHDASVYKAAPQPMALDSGVVYEAQKTGQSVGYVTVRKAAKGIIWTALGKWQPESAVPRPSATPVSAPVSAGGDRPILHRRSDSASAGNTPTPAPSGPPDDRPVLHRGSDTASAQATPTPTPPAPAATPAASEPNEPADPNRPTLRRRTPRSAQEPELSEPHPAKTGQPASAVPPVVPAPRLPTPGPGAQTLVGVSDAEAGDSRSFQFLWKPGEEAAIDAKVRRLAVAQLPRDPTVPPLSERSLTNVVIRSFDLDLSNEAVMVLTAEIPPTFAAPAARRSGPAKKNAPAPAAPAPSPVARYITLIARVDIDGNPQRLAASVTDSSRLDVAPRLELIDAVDVDGDGYGELLFREYSFDEKSFVIYGVGRSTVSKLFEGASQPLK